MASELGEIFKKTAEAYLDKSVRFIVNEGGARSGKTFSTLQLLNALCRSRKIAISVTSETLPHLKLGCIRDFELILDQAGCRDEYEINKSNHVYRHKETGGYVEFISFANEHRARGPQRDILFVNECNNVPYPIIDQLMVRTSKKVLLDYNPVAAFWVDTEIKGRKDAVVIHSTYLDNPFLSAQQVAEIERHKNNENWWRVYGLGLTGQIQGAVYQNNWDIVADDDYPEDAEGWWGLDFGFVNDPTALVEVKMVNGELYVREKLYKKALTNNLIAEAMTQAGVKTYDYVVADSAEKKSIAEINAYNFRVQPVDKYPNSILEGIQVLQDYRIHVTQSSLNLIKELRNYIWDEDKITGEFINRPIDDFNHLLDALRYVALTWLGGRDSDNYDGYVVGL